ncbi:diguanylate cyclase [Geomonas sp. RF6]|uniref:NifB/NifX family molybdenum-iron cluster-binding protein n=1 Tax=Geomonas sp. RF6 TaxID=2897342 RepID=UPI001E361C20|nr:NifB/NifX family molybdenum-iron cluster-binding protein [Geomonas sp. RF6]UFS70140.1 diguanylate cyclase [Geomonas sp. RF6]
MMRVCFPVAEDNGMESEIFGHFGSAPVFLVVDLATSDVAAIQNANRIHDHGGCNPIAALGGERVDGVVVGGIGLGALQKLHAAGMRVYQAKEATVGGNVPLLKASTLPEFEPGQTCRGGHGHGHGHGSGCSH